MAEKKDLSKVDLDTRLKTLMASEMAGNEEVQKILENSKLRYLEFDLEGIVTKVHTAFPREVRYFYEKQKLRPEGQKVGFDESEANAYFVMSKLFVDSPYNTPEFWELYDTVTGRFWGTFSTVYEGIEKSEEKIGDFRKKQGR